MRASARRGKRAAVLQGVASAFAAGLIVLHALMRRWTARRDAG
jgi:hypothetical protein